MLCIIKVFKDAIRFRVVQQCFVFVLILLLRISSQQDCFGNVIKGHMQLVKLMRLETEAEDSCLLLSINSFLVLDFLKSFIEVDDSSRYFG